MTKVMFTPGVTIPKKEIIATDKGTGPVPAWSMSRLHKFESCPYAVYLAAVAKLPGKGGNAAMDRGSAIHTLAEEFVKGELHELPPELAKLPTDFAWLRSQYEDGIVTLEEDWGFNIDWTPTAWMAKDVWARIKLDVFVRLDETCAIIIDHKTGKKFGNELKHGDQGMGYAIAAFMKFPELQFISVRFWYLDKGEKLEADYTREHAMIMERGLHERASKLTTCTNFIPKPSRFNCIWCDFANDHGCEYAIG